jgi:hypothetical protein
MNKQTEGRTDDIGRAISESAQVMISVVWPGISARAFQPPIPRIDPVETITTAEFTRELDLSAGVDYWLVRHQGIHGMASRVQYKHRYDTFTIRKSLPSGKETELQKRMRFVYGEGWIGPYYTCQAYVRRCPTGYELVSAAIARTRDIIGAITQGLSFDPGPAPGGNRFEAVRWDVLRDLGAPIAIWRDPVT